MNNLNYIIDQPLPITQDFKSLKNEGLAHIQKITGNEWTNLNSSDPGVTILDQLCYALTELGYCNNFPIEDILTNTDDKLIIKDQFYLPEEILTTSPVTVDDYIKYIIDEIAEVENAVILPIQSALSYIKGIYTIYLAISPKITEEQRKADICQSVFYRLNKRRNIGEFFMMPIPLKEMPCTLTGNLQIVNQAEASKIIELIQNRIRDYIFPKAVQEDDEKRISNGATIDEIYNGPELRHGWVTENNLGKKKNLVTIRDLTNIIQSITGVESIDTLKIKEANNSEFVTSNDYQLLSFDLSHLSINPKSSSTKDATTISSLDVTTILLTDDSYKELASEVAFGISTNKQIALPKGKYRDINTYYSIQNTFPEIYAVGAKAINSNASDFQIAQSRQLIGYLTLFDQIIANQFSQLANVSQLFSFKNARSGTPSEMQNFYAIKSKYEKEHLEYPVPFLCFSPTYFYQSLYDIPNIRPLLKNNEAFNFSLQTASKSVAEETSWTQFKQDPYNSYIRGLQVMVENETINLARRNEMLDHLLARHGESPLLINTIIEGSMYSGDSQKDKVIIKSLYLQNLGLLSYYRYKGYNYLGAKKILVLQELLDKTTSVGFYLNTASDMKPEQKQWTKFNEERPENFENDFVFNSDKLDRLEKLKIQDFVNYSALELQLNILLGLKAPYINRLQDLWDCLSEKECNCCTGEKSQDEKCSDCLTTLKLEEQIKQCQWFLYERKGFICIENSLLYPSDSTIIVTTSVTNGPYYEVVPSLSYNEICTLYTLMQNAKDIEFHTIENTGNDDGITKKKMVIDEVGYDIEQKVLTDTEIIWQKKSICNSTIMSSKTDYSFSICKSQNDEKTQEIESLTLIFPNYIPYFKTQDFLDRLNLLVTNVLPVEVSHKFQLVCQEKLETLIPAYTDWHNSLVFTPSEDPLKVVKTAAETLILSINLLDT